MEYEFYHADSDELYHFVKGEKVKFHKYIRREPKKSGKGFVYYYNEAKNAVSSAVSNSNKKKVTTSTPPITRKTNIYSSPIGSRQNRATHINFIKNTSGKKSNVKFLNDKSDKNLISRIDSPKKVNNLEKRAKDVSIRMRELASATPSEIHSMITDYYKNYHGDNQGSSGSSEQKRLDYLRKITDTVLSRFPKKSGTDNGSQIDRDADQAAINPNYDPNVYEYSNNCGYCTMAYDMRRRGYDVVARPAERDTNVTPFSFRGGSDYKENSDSSYMAYDMDGNFRSINMVQMARYPEWKSKYTEYFRTKNVEKLIEITEPIYYDVGEKILRDNPDNAYGAFNMTWTTGGGHSMVYEVDNREITIRDCQTGKKYTYDEFIEEVGIYVTDISYIRLDNAIPTENIYKFVEARK